MYISRSEGFAHRTMIWFLCVMVMGLARLGELLGRRRRRRRRHLEVQVDILAGELCLKFSNWILTHMRALGILRPGFYTEFRARSHQQGNLASGAILKKHLILGNND